VATYDINDERHRDEQEIGNNGKHTQHDGNERRCLDGDACGQQRCQGAIANTDASRRDDDDDARDAGERQRADCEKGIAGAGAGNNVQ
jgi:hypothetical protein